MKSLPYSRNPDYAPLEVNRREWLKAGALAALGLGAGMASAAEIPKGKGSGVTRGNIRQSIMGWCFKPMPELELAKHCREIGLVAMEGIGTKFYPEVRELGLNISLVGSHGFKTGPVDPANHEFCIRKLREGIDLAVEVGAPSVITFTGMSVKGMSRKEGAKNCVDCWKAVAPHAEDQGIQLVMEHLNSRDDTHPMKGHPGYFGDDVDFCVELIEQVNSPMMKLLFDVYHVQIMNGDVISRIRQYQDVIGHYHTAGVPGRGELDETQELNYPTIMRAILETGYQGYVAQEFIPTWDDKAKALRHAAKLCDV